MFVAECKLLISIFEDVYTNTRGGGSTPLQTENKERFRILSVMKISCVPLHHLTDPPPGSKSPPDPSSPHLLDWLRGGGGTAASQDENQNCTAGSVPGRPD